MSEGEQIIRDINSEYLKFTSLLWTHIENLQNAFNLMRELDSIMNQIFELIREREQNGE